MKNLIKQQLKEKRNTVKWLAEATGIDYTALTRMIMGNISFELKAGVLIAQALETDIWSLFPELPKPVKPQMATDEPYWEYPADMSEEDRDELNKKIFIAYADERQPLKASFDIESTGSQYVVWAPEPPGVWHKGKISDMEKSLADENDNSYVDHWEEDEKEGLHEPERDW